MIALVSNVWRFTCDEPRCERWGHGDPGDEVGALILQAEREDWRVEAVGPVDHDGVNCRVKCPDHDVSAETESV